jgi:hypothetical protein
VPNLSGIVRLNAKANTTATLGSQVIVGELALTRTGNFLGHTSSNLSPGRNLYLME